MIKTLRTKNFRKLIDNFFEFEPGMVIIRGANEASKTTILESIAYALFGVKSCRGPLSDVVTWGQPENSLSVELVVACEGVDYSIKRSKSGAEITYNGGTVTGQNDCSEFVEKLFGVANGNVGKLIYGSQGDIRGALSQGPKATMDLIENLANFDLLDTIVELVQANLLTGPTAASEAVLAAAEHRHELVQASLVEPDVSEWEEHALRYEREAVGASEDMAGLKPECDEALVLLVKADKQNTEALRLQGQIDMYSEQIVSRNLSIKTNLGVACPTEKDLEDAEKDLENAKNATWLMAEYVGMKVLVDAYPDVVWEGSEESLDVEISNTEEVLVSNREDLARTKSDVRLYESQKVTGSVCGFCNRDVSKFPEIEAKNKDLDEKIKATLSAGLDYATNEKDARETLVILNGIKAAQKIYKGKGTSNVKEHTGTVPYSLSWIGAIPKPADNQEIESRQSSLAMIKNARARYLTSSAKIAADKEMIGELQRKVDTNNGLISTLTHVPEINRIREISEDLQARMKVFTDTRDGALYNIEKIRETVSRELSDYATAKKGVEASANDVEKAKKDVAELVFNNALVKKLRSARPLIADRLWNVVLSAVSTYFSVMRGVKSVVTKEPNGFKVDGQSVEGLSGSTLDILGLSIRLALTRTFLPEAPFLILDEPSAAMDDKRTQEVTSFLLAFGFRQTIMVTHKDIDEAAANQLILL